MDCPNSLPDLPPLPEAPFERSERLGRLKLYVEQHLAEPFSAADAARLLHLERTYFSKFFRRRVGICFSDWVRLVRLHKALELLRETHAPIPVVADLSGFSTVRSLQRAIRRIVAVTPQEYRARHRGTK